MNLSYEQRRSTLYGPLREEGIFTWDHMYGEEYALASLHMIDEEFRKEIAYATEQLGLIFSKVIPVLQQGPDELLVELGIPKQALGAVRLSVWPEIPTLIGRFDFAQTPEGLKMLEFNSDTPTSIVEAYHVNGRVCQSYGVKDPNLGMAGHLRDGFQQLVLRYNQKGFETKRIVFSALDWHEEDKGTAKYLLNVSQLEGLFVPLEDLRVYEDSLHYLEQEQYIPIDVLYRLHALEKMAEEQDADGYPTGAHVLDLIARNKLAVINPPSGFLAQTKALQALIWNLHESKEFFTDNEHRVIETYMLPTYMENRFLGTSPFVSKPIFGREGGGVTLFGKDGELIARDLENDYWEQPMIYQQLAELETVEVETVKGLYTGNLLWGSFLVGGKASAIVARVGGKITGNLSFYLPVGLT
ncbi:glutathionylspermidine synthase family protein [Effusibacillus lacus]|uniref:Glutathionylspermidine synthase n=1 Tax=Effusibacillus lacus TaxID=1348429 RepID=A0A292YJL3_9BACL|nr:glutathionylspermidine synthase family protein [Effusibacillus lacus]TCS76967.1 glutathionylspermidine synthase [Effusibacillus lacus]GAX91297.1 glutathionylspermidine synthase [Effusibacillus lacus]